MAEGNKKAGDEGEQLAADLLEQTGFKILCRNFRSGRGEIDIICEKDELLIFVEVKTRKNLEFGEPEYGVTKSKQKQIIKVAKLYLYEKEIRDVQCRFDVIAILLEDPKNPQINHIENAFIDM